MPRPGPRRGAGGGRPLRHLRIRHPHAAGGLGRQARPGRRPRVHRHHRRPGRRRRRLGARRGGGRRERRPGAGAAVAASRASRRSARTARARSSTATTAPSPATCWSGRASLLRLPAGPRRPARPRWPSRWPWPCTGSPARASAPATRVMVIGAGPDRGAVHRRPGGPRASGRSPSSSPASGARQLAADLGADRGARSRRPRDVPAVGAGAHRRSGPSTSCSSAPARRRPWRPASTSCAGAAPWSWSAPGIEHPAFDPNRFILNELHVVGSFVYDQGRLRAGPRAAGLRRLPHRPADRGGRRAPRPAVRGPGGLAEGRFAGKVMVVPRLSDDAPAPAGRGGRDGPPLLPDRQPPVQPRGHEPAGRPARRDATGPTSAGSGARSSASTRSTVMTEDRRRLILSCVHWDQFIFLIAEDDPMRCPRMDHFGFSVGIAGGTPGGPGPGRRPSANTTTGSTSSTCTPTTRRWSRSTRSTSGTCCR